MPISMFAWSLLRPSSLLLLCQCLGLVLWLSRRRAGAVMLVVALALDLAVALLPVGDWAMATLEDRYDRRRVWPDHVDGIIALGGAVVPSLTEVWHRPALTDGAERMTEFVALARHYPEARLVFAGGAGRPGEGHLREADVARQLFVELGLDPRRILFERQSLTTEENARLAKALAEPRDGETWLLVTSAFHMPRAAASFRRQGWAVTPWPVGFKSGRGEPWSLSLNRPLSLLSLDYACHEWAGMIFYRLKGWA